MKLEDKQLVILTTHFGTNFSGGSTATCEIFSRLEQHFKGVTVIGTQLGEHSFESLEFVRYQNWWDGLKAIRQWANKEAIFYGDFYNAFLFVIAKVPFFFTYHDNWPEMRQFGLRNRIRSLFYTSAYVQIFRKAQHVFSVSEFKAAFISRFTDRISVVRNGFSKEKPSMLGKSSNVLMVGNIDARKYIKAYAFFKYLEQQGPPSVQIDIYGRVIDQSLADRLSAFSFVRIKGFHDQVPYGQYKFLLHTSVMENLPITFCEALYHGVPVVAFDVGGSSEIIGEEQGILVSPYSIEALYRAFTQMTTDEQLRTFQCDVPADHSWDFCSEQYLKEISTS